MPFAFEANTTPVVVPGGVTDVPQSPTGFAFERDIPNSVQQTVRNAVEVSPDENAKINDLSKRAGVDRATVALDPKQVELDTKTEEIVAQTAENPTTHRFLAQAANAQVAHDSVRELTAIEQITRAFKRGALGRELGLTGNQYRADQSPDTKAKLEELQSRLDSLGREDGDGFLSFLTSASEVVGQMASSLGDPQLAVRVTAGAATGATLGAFGGPLAPATAVAGGIAGMAAGAITHFVQDSFEVEGGNAYVEMLDEGVDPAVAKPLSIGVGVINAALETASEAVLAAPLAQAGKTLLKSYVSKAMKTQTVRGAAGQFARAYVGGIAAETATEGMQEFTQIVAAEWGKQMSEMDLEAATEEEIVERVTGVMVTTMKAMSILAAPGPGMQWATNKRRAEQAETDQKAVKDLQGAMEESPLTERDPEAAAMHVVEALGEQGITDAYISAEAFNEWIDAFEDKEGMLKLLGAEDQYVEAQTLGTDIKISADAYARYVLTNENYKILEDRIKFDEDGLTKLEADELKSAGVSEVIADDELGDSLGKEDEVTDFAAKELGLRALFKTADEAGISEGNYANYLRKIDEAHQETARRQKDNELRKQQKLLTDEYRSKYQKIEAEELESVGNQPVHAAVRGLQIDRLDYELTKTIIGGEVKLANLPRQAGGRTIYGEKGVSGIDPDAYAQLYGYDDAHEMFMDMLTSPSFKDAVQTATVRRAQVEIGDIFNERQAVLDARKALMNDKIIDFLTTELRVMEEHLQKGTDVKGRPKSISMRLIRNAAKARIAEMKIQDISPNRFLLQQHRYAVAAGKALRDRQQGKAKGRIQGDRNTAVEFKYQQIINYQMAIEASRIQEKVEQHKTYLAKFAAKSYSSKGLPIEALENIRQALVQIRFDNTIQFKKPKYLGNLAHDEVDPIEVPNLFLDEKGRYNYQIMTFEDFEEVVSFVKAIEKKGRDADKLRKEAKGRELSFIIAALNESVSENLRQRPKDTTITKTTWESLKDHTHEYAMLWFNMDTLVRELDGFKEQGLAYSYLKRPYDRAMSNGYQTGQMGFIRREQQEAKAINQLYSVFTKKERINFTKKVDVPGVSKRISHQEVLAVILNSGTKSNRDALVAGKEFTPDEIQSIMNYASKKDLDFAQSVWDYLDTLWPEIESSEMRRKNVRPPKVAAEFLDTQHGMYRGGYYPLSYGEAGSMTMEEKDTAAMLQRFRQGQGVASQTRAGHKKARTNSGGKPVSMNLHVLNFHVKSVIYDLEVGDAVNDIFKVLHAKEVRAAFNDQGQNHKWQMMNLWLRDAVVNEVGSNSVVEKGARWLRNGFTISALGWNVSTALLQPLGLVQTAVVIGKRNTIAGILSTLSSPKIFKQIDEMSPFMASRSATWHKDITDAQRQLTFTVLDKYTPGKSAEFIRDSFFWMIKKTQRVTDVMTWVGAQRKGLQLFEGNIDKAIEYADRMVARSQASGIFGDRTSLERGSYETKRQQTEMIRAWTGLISYFMAKTNIAIEKTKKTKWNNPVSVASWATDMVLLYVVEAALGVLVRGNWPDDEDEEGAAKKIAEATMQNIAGGLPGIREVVSVYEGFQGGGVLGAVAESFGNMFTQASQGELDAAFVKSMNKALGIMLHYPAGQINKTIGGAQAMEEDEDTSAIRLLMGPKF